MRQSQKMGLYETFEELKLAPDARKPKRFSARTCLSVRVYMFVLYVEHHIAQDICSLSGMR